LAERRQHPRTTTDLRVHWQRVVIDAAAPEHLVATGPAGTASARDMSRAGLAFVTPSELTVGTALTLALDRSFGGPPLSALGRVVRCERDGGQWIVGVELTWIECVAPEQALGLHPENAWTLL